MSLLSRLRGPAIPETTPADAEAACRRGGALLLDVRERNEWDSGHAPTAMHLPLGSLSSSLSRLPKAKRVYVVCRSGSRSAQAVSLLAAQGYDAVNVSGGMGAWQRAGLPVTIRH